MASRLNLAAAASSQRERGGGGSLDGVAVNPRRRRLVAVAAQLPEVLRGLGESEKSGGREGYGRIRVRYQLLLVSVSFHGPARRAAGGKDEITIKRGGEGAKGGNEWGVDGVG